MSPAGDHPRRRRRPGTRTAAVGLGGASRGWSSPAAPPGSASSLVLLASLGRGAGVAAPDRWTTRWWAALAAALALMPRAAHRGLGGGAVACSARSRSTVCRAARATTLVAARSRRRRLAARALPGPFVAGRRRGADTSSAVVRGGVLGGAARRAVRLAARRRRRRVRRPHRPHRPATSTTAPSGWCWPGSSPPALGAFALVAAAERRRNRPRSPRRCVGRDGDAHRPRRARRCSSPPSSPSRPRRSSAATRFVQRTAGLTYAEYAREGFAAAAGRRRAHARRDRRRRPRSAAPTAGCSSRSCVLTLVILASAWHRLGLYSTPTARPGRASSPAGRSPGWRALFVLVARAPRAVPAHGRHLVGRPRHRVRPLQPGRADRRPAPRTPTTARRSATTRPCGASTAAAASCR